MLLRKQFEGRRQETSLIRGPLPTLQDVPRGSLLIPGVEPRVFMFQPPVTLYGGENTQAIQTYGLWFDGRDVPMIQFKVEIMRIVAGAANPSLILESAQHAELEPSEWEPIKVWSTRPSTTGVDFITVVSDSPEGGLLFSRFIRWRVCSTAGPDAWGPICFRIKGMVGATLSQWPEAPRLV